MSKDKDQKNSTRRIRIVPRARKNDVGYGHPPREHQFKPGQSGNPKGRPKGSKNESTILRELLDRRIEIRSNGRIRKISLLEGIHTKMAEKALFGDPKTATFLLNRYAALVSGELRPEDLNDDDDREVLDAFIQRRNSGAKP